MGRSEIPESYSSEILSSIPPNPGMGILRKKRSPETRKKVAVEREKVALKQEKVAYMRKKC